MTRNAITEVPYVDLINQHKPLKAALLAAAGAVIDRADFILGEEVWEFERRFAELHRVPHAIGVANGTDALVLALSVLGVGPGDEVITPPNSYVASTSCIALAGAKPVFVDVDHTYNLDPTKIEASITPRTKAIIAVHLTGRPADMSAINTIAVRHALFVIEDAAQAVLAQHRGRPVGSLGTIGCFSLHPLKTLSCCGDGGVITTHDAAIADKLRLMRNIGLRSRDDCVIWAGNSRLDTLHAAMLLVKLEYLAEWTEKRRANAASYRELLHGVGEVVCPPELPGELQVNHTFVVLAERRDALKEYLAEHGVGTSVHYPTPIHLHAAAKDLGYSKGSFPVAEYQSERILSLPIYDTLGRDKLEYVAATITDFYAA